jgi:hypothetical protein
MKYHLISRIEFLLAPIPPETINRVWSRVQAENLTLDNYQVAAKVEQHFGIRTL